MTQNPHTVAVIGAGPVGLAAAAHLAARGIEPLVFEAGDAVGASIREWGHVRVFSPWEFNIDPAAARAARRGRLDAPGRRRLPDRRRDRRALPRAAGEPAGDRAGAAPRRARDRRDASWDRQAQGRRPRGGAVRAGRRGGRRGAALPRLGGDRRVGDVDAAEPARRGRAARPRRARGGRPDRVRDPGRARRRPRALRRPAGARGRQRPLGVQRDPRPRHAARLRARHRDRLGDPRRRARPQVRRRGRRPAAGPRRPRRHRPRARRRRLGRARRRLPDPQLSLEDGRVVVADGDARSRPTRSSPRPASARTCRCWASCGSTSTIASRRRARSLR